jgi:carboxypeptidase C (cathepsin A)
MLPSDQVRLLRNSQDILFLNDSSRRVISHFLDRPDVRTALGVDPQVPGNFSACSATVGKAFNAAQDGLHSSTEYVSALLARRVRVLIYVGTYDWICNWIGNEAWTRTLEWHGEKDFASLPLREWKVDGHVVGKTRSAHGLTFATVDGAGHMVRFSEFLLSPFRTNW